MRKQVISFSLLVSSLRKLISLMAILCFTLETFTSVFPGYANGQSVRVTLIDADHFSSIRLTKDSSTCLGLQVTHNLVDGSPTRWIGVRPNATITPVLYARPKCSGTSRRTDPSRVNVGTVDVAVRVKICNEEGKLTSLPNFTLLEDGMCFAYNGYIMANGVEYPVSGGGEGPQ